jgi:hypothetical protein
LGKGDGSNIKLVPGTAPKDQSFWGHPLTEALIKALKTESSLGWLRGLSILLMTSSPSLTRCGCGPPKIAIDHAQVIISFQGVLSSMVSALSLTDYAYESEGK